MKPTSLLSLFALFLGCATSGPAVSPPSPAPAPAAAAPAAPEPPRLRLGDAARPLGYDVLLSLVPTRETFSGVVDMKLELREPLAVLWLNAEELTLQKVEARAGEDVFTGRPLPAKKNFVGIAFDRPLPAGAVALHVEYEGPLARRDSSGISRQQEGDDWYIFSDFEPLDARRAFPCFDEPSFKVPWQLTLEIRKEDVAFSNTPVEAQEEAEGGFKRVRFARTAPMPSYLVAFAVGPFERVDAGRAGLKGTPVGIVTPRGLQAQARYAAQVAPQVLAGMEEYFGIPYPYEKLDLIAVPFQGGAMENPGLVTYHQPLLLSRPERETLDFRRDLDGVTAHELAHQWFGDLVTTAWWDDLWLNEAFATWMAPKFVERWQPRWGAAEYRAGVRSGAMFSDSLVTARKIRQPIESSDDVRNAFDGITYGKGGSVIHMFERWVGPDVFQRGVQRYLREHAHGVATAADFLAAISAEAGRDISPAFSTFLDQPGVPLVTVELRCEQGQAPHLLLSQQRYLPEGSEGAPESAAQRWHIPVCVRWAQGKASGSACTLLTEAQGVLPLEAKGCPDWVLPNDGAAGYYRTLLSSDLLARLLKDGFRRLSVPERIATVTDMAALSRAGRLPYAEVLRHVPRLAQDPSRHVVQVVANLAEGVRASGLVSPAQRPRYAAFIRHAFGARARALGWTEKPGEDEDTRLLRARLLTLVGDEGEDPKVGAQARALALAWLVDRTAVSPNLVEPVLQLAAATGDQALFERFLQAAKQEPDRTDRQRLLRALGNFRRPELAQAALGLLLDSAFDPRETSRILREVTQEPALRPLAYTFLKDNFDALVARLPRDAPASFPWVGASLCDEEARKDVAAFFAERSTRFTGGPRVLAQALESMRLCTAFRNSQGPGVEQFLKDFESRPAVPRPR